MSALVKNHVVTGFRRLFLLVSPNETSFEKYEDVPDYVEEAVPFFGAMIIIECLVLHLEGKTLPRLNDSFSSLSNGLLSLLHSLLFRSTELAVFLWVYERFNIITLPWDNPLTWILALVGYDFAYYWVHRFGHEVNIMWAGHQAHHNSEDYNLSTALRQSFVHRYFFWMFYMPLALFLPPSLFLVHTQLNLLYQFWVHTETVGKLGPLEWFLSTPSHHRVHHGRNPYCIDKNYGGIFIIWDRIFGTFEVEKDDEKVVYGLVHNINTWDPLYAQLFHLKYIIVTAWKVEGFSNKLSVIFKGPGWSPGKPRLGCIEDIPQVEANVQKYDSHVGWLKSSYIWFHFLFILAVWHPMLSAHKESLSVAFLLTHIAYIVFSLFVFGSIYDNRPYSDLAEMIRCSLFLLIWHVNGMLPFPQFVYWMYLLLTITWTLVVVQKRLFSKSKKFD